MKQLVVINDLYVMRIAAVPSKTNPPLVVDANAVLSFPFSVERLQTIAGRYPEIRKLYRGIKHP